MQSHEHALAVSAWLLCEFSVEEIAGHAGVEPKDALDFLDRFADCFNIHAPAEGSSPGQSRRWQLRQGRDSASLRILAESGASMSTAVIQLPPENAKQDDRSIAEALILSAETTADPIRRERRLASAGVYLRHHEFSVLAERRRRLREDVDQARVLSELRTRMHAALAVDEDSDGLDGVLLDVLQDWTQDPRSALRGLPAQVFIDAPDDCDTETDEVLVSWVLDDPASRTMQCLPAARAVFVAERLTPARWSLLRQALFRRSVETLSSPGADERLVSLAVLAVALSSPTLAPVLLAARLMQEARDADRMPAMPELLLASLSRLCRDAEDDNEELMVAGRRQAAAVCAFLISRECSNRDFELLAPGALAVVSPAEAKRLTAMLVRNPGMPGAFFRTVAVALFSSAHQEEINRVIDEQAARQEAEEFFKVMTLSGASALQDGPDGLRLVPMARVQKVLRRKHDGMSITMDEDGEVAGRLALTMTQLIWQDRSAGPSASPRGFRARLKRVPEVGSVA